MAGKTVKASAEEKKSLEVPVMLAISNPVPWNATKNPYLYQVKVSNSIPLKVVFKHWLFK